MRVKILSPGVDFLTDYDEWLAIQNGNVATRQQTFLPGLRFITSARDFAHWVDVDVCAYSSFVLMCVCFHHSFV